MRTLRTLTLGRAVRWSAFVAASVAALVTASPSIAAPPPNDNYAMAVTLVGNHGFILDVSNVGATTEAGETVVIDESVAGAGAGATIWFRWVAPETRLYRFSTCGGPQEIFPPNTTIAVYSPGPGEARTLHARNVGGACGWGEGEVVFAATTGTEYRIQIAGELEFGFFPRVFDQGAIDLHWSPAERPLNDHLLDAQALEGLSGHVTNVSRGDGSSVLATTAGATSELGEPLDPLVDGRDSIWWRWTAPASQRFHFWTCAQRISASGDEAARAHRVAVYVGDTAASLAPVALPSLASCDTVFDATEGMTYALRVSSFRDLFSAPIAFGWAPEPTNDDFADAILLSGTSGSVSGTAAAATTEAGEPAHAGGRGDSIWYGWIAPQTGSVSFRTCGSAALAYFRSHAPSAIANVYAGSYLDGLTPVAAQSAQCRTDSVAGRESALTLRVTAGQSYAIAVVASYNETLLSWSYAAPNDDFGSAEPLIGEIGTVTSSTFGATVEEHERLGLGGFGLASIWYRFTAPSSGRTRFDVCGSSFAPVLTVATGTALSDLSPLVLLFHNQSVCPASSFANVETTAGATYWISIASGGFGIQGMTRLNWQFVPFDRDPPVLSVPTEIIAPATGLLGATVTYVASASDAVDPAPTVACEPASGTLFLIGATTVTCTATDSAGNGATAAFVVEVTGARTQLEDLAALIEDLNLPLGIANSLEAKLASILAALDAASAGAVAAACNKLDAFVAEVRAQAGKAIVEADAAMLIAHAQRIMQVIGC
jgi:hypothetical protein